MKSNSCKVCASSGIVKQHSSDVNQRRKLASKSVGSVVRRNPPVSTKTIRDMEDEVKQMWYRINRFIIKRLAFELKRTPFDVMNFLYKMSFTKFGQAMKLINRRRKSCYVPLASANYDIYFEIFDNDGNLRNPLRKRCLDQLLQIMRVAFAEKAKRVKKSGGSSLFGGSKAQSIKLPVYRNKSDYYSSCDSSGQLRCKPLNNYKIDGRYAGLNVGGLVGYRADAIGKKIVRLGCKDSCKGGKVQSYCVYDDKSKYDDEVKDDYIKWPRFDHGITTRGKGRYKEWLEKLKSVLPSESKKENLNGMKKKFISGNGKELPKVYKVPFRSSQFEDELFYPSPWSQKYMINDISDHYDDVVSGKRRNRKYYFAEPIPISFHEPFDKTKPWTWMRRHPGQMRFNDKGKASHSNIRRYRRQSVDANFKKANKRFSIESTFSNTSTKIQPMFGI